MSPFDISCWFSDQESEGPVEYWLYDTVCVLCRVITSCVCVLPLKKTTECAYARITIG